MKIYNKAGDLIFEGEDLSGANLRGANLTGANLTGAKGLPEVEKMEIKSAICAQVCATPENLKMGDWHTCDTVHCLAGWAVVLHPQGKELEQTFGTENAGRMIFAACEGEVPDFYSDEKTAMNWLKSATN